MQSFYRKHKKKVVKVNTKSELEQNINKYSANDNSYELLLQEIIPGSAKNLYSVCFVRYDGKIHATLTARRKRQYPIDFGDGSTYVETCICEEIYELGKKLINYVDYNSICEVEFKFDSRDGKYKLLEVNPRLWKWHLIGSLIGLNFPLLYLNANAGDKTIVALNDKHVSWRDIISDTITRLLELKEGNYSFKDMINELKTKNIDSIFSWKDIMLFLYLIWLLPHLCKGARSGI